MQEARLDNRMKKEYHELLNTMLTNCASIITETFNIRFHEAQNFNFALPPTVYEYLWRYEYMSFKNSVTDVNPIKKMNLQNQPDENFLNVDELANKQGSDLAFPNPPFLNQMDIVASNGSVFFDSTQLKKLVEQQFEY